MNIYELVAALHKSASIAEEISKSSVELDSETNKLLTEALEVMASRASGIKGRNTVTCPKCHGSGNVLKQRV